MPSTALEANEVEDFIATLRVPEQALERGAGQTLRPNPKAAMTGERALVGALPALDEDRELKFEGVLGEGGMGVVHEAVQLALGRRVAVKSLKAHRATPQAAVELLREARGTGSLEHPNIVPVYALGRTGAGEPLLVMRKIEGTRLSDLLRRLGPSPSGELLRRRVRAVIQVCHALAFAHSRGVVHRDVKPDNVMIGAFGEVVLLDWGVAMQVGDAAAGGFPNAAELSGLAGTPAYMAPEQVRPKPDRISERTDVFLVGGLLHEVVTGSPPNQAPNVHAVLFAASQAGERHYGGDVDPELAAILRRAMHPDPLTRFDSARALGDALEAWLEHEASSSIAREARRTLEVAGSESTSDARHRRFADARLAFELALRSWPENPDAKRGLEECLARQAAQFLDEKNVGEARRLIAMLRAPDEALVAREHALEVATEAEAARLAELEKLSRDLDLTGATRAGAVLSAALGLFWAAAPAVVQLGIDRHWLIVTAAQSVILGVPLFALTVAIPIWVTRRDLLANVAGRRLAWLLVLSVGATALFRSLAWMQHWPLAREMPLELSGYAVVLFAAAATLRSTFARGGVVYVLAALVAARWPGIAFYATAVGNGVGLLAVAPGVAEFRRACAVIGDGGA